ncbi:MAG: hypothetical protein Kow0073_02650 [Immundisolibacter sp.]
MNNDHDAYLAQLKKKFGPYLQYASADLREREALRCTLPPQLLVDIHKAVGEELDQILEILDQYPLDAIPEQWQPIGNLVLFLAEIDSPVVKWIPRYGLAHLPDALDPRHFETKKNFYDMDLSVGRTWMAERIG